jgi:hypothetical protein
MVAEAVLPSEVTVRVSVPLLAWEYVMVDPLVPERVPQELEWVQV